MINDYGYLGKWTIKVIDKITGKVTEETIKNRIMKPPGSISLSVLSALLWLYLELF